MRAVRVHRHGEPAEALQLDDDIAVPEPGPDQVRVRVEATALSMPDVMLCRGGYPLTPGTLPFVPGMEASGVVSAVGEGVDPAWLGQRVVGSGILPHGTLADETLMRAPGCTRCPTPCRPPRPRPPTSGSRPRTRACTGGPGYGRARRCS